MSKSPSAFTRSFSRRMSGRERTRLANRQLGLALAFIAGAANAGGFLAVHLYTSHMTGVVSGIADQLVLGQWKVALLGVVSLFSFILGALVSTFLIKWARKKQMHSEYALTLFLEAVLMLVFGVLGFLLQAHWWLLVSLVVWLLCFMMGLQNAIITKISHSEIRTTHVTGIVTDMGIALGKLTFWRLGLEPVKASQRAVIRKRFKLHSSLLLSFLGGGVIGAVGFQTLGFFATFPLAILLLGLSATPVWDDVREKFRAPIK